MTNYCVTPKDLPNRRRWRIGLSGIWCATVLTAVGAFPHPAVAATPVRVPPAQLRLLNYYPASHPWSGMWTAYSHTDTVSDFARIAGLGANAVRIIVIPSVMGFAGGSVPPADAAHLADMVHVAASDGLSVQLTLFDTETFWDPSSQTTRKYADYPGLTKTWLSSLLAPYRTDPHVALAEVENEMNPYDPAQMAWARQVLGWLPGMLPGVPRTASTWGSSDGSREAALIDALGAGLDVLDGHLYGTPGENAAVLQTMQARALGRPIIVGEAGANSGTARSVGGDEAQAKAYSLLLEVTHAYGIADFAPWTLDDLTPAGTPSWLTPADQAFYGLFRTDGSAKPAASVVKAMFGQLTGTLPPLNFASPGNMDGGFENENTGPTAGLTLGSWQEYLPSLAGILATADGQGIAGSRAAEVGHTGTSPDGVASLFQRFVAPRPGTPVQASAQVHLVSATGCSAMSLAWFSGDSYLGNVTAPCADNARSGWQPISLTAPVPNGVTEFQLYLQSAGNAGVAFFDNTTVTFSPAQPTIRFWRAIGKIVGTAGFEPTTP